MKLRKEILPQMDIAKERYAEILKLIVDYTSYCDEYDDPDLVIYQKIEEHLTKLTGKEMTNYNLYEWWEEEEAEVLAFRIALPNPIKVDSITKDELTEVLKRIKVYDESLYEKEQLSFEEEFSLYLDDYYHAWLKLNFTNYDYAYFIRNKTEKGDYSAYSIEELVDKLYS